MKRWLSRLSFSFLILAIVLIYEAYRGMSGRTDEPMSPVWTATLLALGVICFILGGVGLRERHRR